MIRTIDPTACDEALPVIGAEPIAEIIRAHRISVYSDRWDALRRTWAGRGRELARNTVETVIVDARVPAESPKGVCAFPGCGRSAKTWRKKVALLCSAHHKQRQRRGSMSALTPLLGPSGRHCGYGVEDRPCRKCGASEWRYRPRQGRRRLTRSCVPCDRRRNAAAKAKQRAKVGA